MAAATLRVRRRQYPRLYRAVKDFFTQLPTFTVPLALRAVTNDPFTVACAPFVARARERELAVVECDFADGPFVAVARALDAYISTVVTLKVASTTKSMKAPFLGVVEASAIPGSAAAAPTTATTARRLNRIRWVIWPSIVV